MDGRYSGIAAGIGIVIFHIMVGSPASSDGLVQTSREWEVELWLNVNHNLRLERRWEKWRLLEFRREDRNKEASLF